jgi:site-specific recombinase XerD
MSLKCPRKKCRRRWSRLRVKFCDVWLRASNRAPKTIQAYRCDITQFIRFLPQSMSPRRVSRGTIEAWVAHLQDRKYEASSIRRKLASLRCFFGYLVDQKDVDVSPLRELRIRLGSSDRLTQTISRADIRAILKIANRNDNHRHRPSPILRLLRARDSLLVRLLCLTGIRVGELAAIQITDVQRRERTIVIRGKGRRERLAFVADPKTALILDSYLDNRRELLPGKEALFTDAVGGQLSTDAIRYVISLLSKAAGVSTRVTPHMFRHTAATRLMEHGVNLRVVQEFLGHTSIRSTERYTHVAPNHLRRILHRANPLKQLAS